MKVFSWMQSRLKMKRPSNTVLVANKSIGKATSNEEFSDWPESLLAIGTFGISNLRENPEEPTAEHESMDTKEEEEEELDRSYRVVDHKNNMVITRKKSITFLLKQFFTSRNIAGLNHVKDPSFDKPRMEKILRAILKNKKKIHPQTSCTAKVMSNKHLITLIDDDDDDKGYTWVKTDSEYIVLEI